MNLWIYSGLFAAMTGLYLYGGYQLSRYASVHDGQALMLSIGAYFGGNALLLSFMKSGPYGSLMVLSSLAVLLGHVAISIGFMGEKYSTLQFCGVACACLGIVLVGWPQVR